MDCYRGEDEHSENCGGSFGGAKLSDAINCLQIQDQGGGDTVRSIDSRSVEVRGQTEVKVQNEGDKQSGSVYPQNSRDSEELLKLCQSSDFVIGSNNVISFTTNIAIIIFLPLKNLIF